MGQYAEIAERAADKTDKELARELAALAPLNLKQVEELLPTRKDKKEFNELMKVVEDETDKNEQLSYLGKKLDIVLTVLKSFL